MSRIITCISNASNIENLCSLSHWASTQTSLPISLLHVAQPHEDSKAKVNMSGALGLGAKSDILESLTKEDEAHGRKEREAGNALLTEAEENLQKLGAQTLNSIHQRGHFIDIIEDLEAQTSLLILGRQNEAQSSHSLEKTMRESHTPLLIAGEGNSEIKRFLIAHDGSVKMQKLINFISDSKIFKGLECHVLHTGEATDEEDKLITKDLESLRPLCDTVKYTQEAKGDTATTISNYILNNNIDLLCTGAYKHSKLHNFILGSTTDKILKAVTVPILSFH